jgi:2-(1,2-epoxy-1,2-dihydrophenyl)acetyl-CoA isomerase
VDVDLEGWTGLQVTRPTERVLQVELHQPERLNALTAGMKRDLIELLTQAQADEQTRAVLFTGAGRAFCGGDYVHKAYMTERSTTVPHIGGGHTDAASTYEGLRIFSQGLVKAVRELDKPTIAAINGPAIQSGLSLALACDFRLASPTARLGSATLRFALMPDEGGHWLLLQHLGLSGAVDFLLRKRIVDADEALAKGLVNEIVPADELLPSALALADELANGPSLAMRMLKRAIYKAADDGLAQAFDDIAVRTAITDHHPDATEGSKAFFEKRPPNFR